MTKIAVLQLMPDDIGSFYNPKSVYFASSMLNGLPSLDCWVGKDTPIPHTARDNSVMLTPNYTMVCQLKRLRIFVTHMYSRMQETP